MQSPHITASVRVSTPTLVLNRKRLDELRKAHGIESDADLARVIGVNVTTLFRVSKGDSAPSNTFMAKVRLAFPAASLDQLFMVAA